MRKLFEEAQAEIIKLTIASVMTVSNPDPDLGGGDVYDGYDF